MDIFYNNVEQFVLTDIMTHIGHPPSVLYLYISDKKKLMIGINFVKLCIGNNVNEFFDNIKKYEISLHNQKFDVVNIRFSVRHFFKAQIHLSKFLDFVTNYLKGGGFLIGYALASDKLNASLMTESEIVDGPYYLRVPSRIITESIYPYNNIIYVNSNDTDNINYMVDLNELTNICLEKGLFYIGVMDFEKIYIQRAPAIVLQDYEKTFGFLNYVFIFQFTTVRTSNNILD